MAGWMHNAARLLRHRWGEGQLAKVMPQALVEQLTRQVAASEQRHTGQVRICVEAGLPTAYIWRGASARERALALFGKLGVWDTEHNNGVLVYLLLADHAIEIVADRALARQVPPQTWKALVEGMGEALRAGHHEVALTGVLAAVSDLLAQHFPPVPGAGTRTNELPDAPVLAGDSLLY